MWAQWLSTFPAVAALPLDLGGGGPDDRRLPAVPWLAQRLLSPDEGCMLDALAALAQGDPLAAARTLRGAVAAGAQHPDVQFLAAACDLAQGRCADALEPLHQLYLRAADPDSPQVVGAALRHCYPALRCLVRITPTQLLPIYPSPFGVALLYAVALDACGQRERSLAVLREMVPLYGLLDELRIMAARIHLDLGNVDQAYASLTHADCSQQDALQFTLSFYIGYCHYVREEYRLGAQQLGSAVRTAGAVNPHTQARARLLLAELYGRCGLLLDALRESGSVEPAFLPRDVAALVLAREERWLNELLELDVPELERLADADVFQAYIPEPREAPSAVSKLDSLRDPLAQQATQSLSWAQRKRDAVDLAEARAALARGEGLPPRFKPRLTAAGAVLLGRIEAAEEWWPERRQALSAVTDRPELALNVMAEAGQLRFDFRGNREPSLFPLEGEKRAKQALSVAGTVVAVGAVLVSIRTCAAW